MFARPALAAALAGCSLLMAGCSSLPTPETPDFLLTQQQRVATGPEPRLAGIPGPGWAEMPYQTRPLPQGAKAADGTYTMYAAPASCTVEVQTLVARSGGADLSWGKGDDRQLSDSYAKKGLGYDTKGTRIEGLDSDVAVSEVVLKGDKGKVSAREGSAKITGYEARTLTHLSESTGQGFYLEYLCQGSVDYATWAAIKDGITVVGLADGEF